MCVRKITSNYFEQQQRSALVVPLVRHGELKPGRAEEAMPVLQEN